MKSTKKIRHKIDKHIKIFIDNSNNFFKLFNNYSIITGKYLIHIINNDINMYIDKTSNNDELKNNEIDIICNLENFKLIKLFLLNNCFIYTFNSNNSNIRYIKSINRNELIINILIDNNPIKNLKNINKLKIENIYYNGALILNMYKKELYLKYETIILNNNDEKTYQKILHYIKYGYKFKIIYENQKIITFNYFNKKSYIFKYILYKCKFK